MAEQIGSATQQNSELPDIRSWRSIIGYMLKSVISVMGFIAALIFGIFLLALVANDVFGSGLGNPYDGMIVYIIVPTLFTGAFLVGLFGMFLRWRRYKKILHGQPVAHPSRGKRLLAIAAGAVLTSAWLGLSSFGIYQAYHYSDSVKFCGLVCHQVMIPEYTAYKESQHARVACVECHIGPGAGWFVRAKITGMHQLLAVATHSYHTPIKTPLANLRPAQETCEECHWPSRFSGSVERVGSYFDPREKDNKPFSVRLLMHVGGGDASKGVPKGAHWHISSEWKVQYLPLDSMRQDIPYVRVTYKDGHFEEFTSKKFEPKMLQEHELRSMDCLDCHNRPSHVFKSPDRALNEAMGQGLISSELPWVKKIAREAMEKEYKTTPEALAAIDKAFDDFYSKNPVPDALKDDVAKAKEQTKRLFSINIFPEQGVDYRAFVNNLGHREFVGCERCHDGKHKAALPAGAPADAKPKAVTKECNACHTIVGLAAGREEIKAAKYGNYEFQDFYDKHPGGEYPKAKNCSSSDCHGIAGKKAE